MHRVHDVLIIGGGPAGLMAAVAAGREGADVLLVEKGDRLGRKLMISGGGRCNVTNAKDLDALMKNILGNPRFMYSAFSVFNNRDIIQFFEGLGIALKEEDRGRMFPVTDSAKTVADALIRHIRELGVRIQTNTSIARLRFDENACVGAQLESGIMLEAHGTVVAVGGCSVPKTGSTGDGYVWAREAGHTIIDPYPTEVGLCSDEAWIQSEAVKGLSLQDVTQTLWDARGKKISSEEGDMIFTHFGLSGPVSLRTSHYVSVSQRKWGKVPLKLTIDVCPQQSTETIVKDIMSKVAAEPRKSFRNALKGWLPDRFLILLLDDLEINGDVQCANVRRETMESVASTAKAFPVRITGTLPLAQATVTGGGVSVKEIHPQTMESKKKEGLFFAGEVMDVHAHTGGYNITVAFSSGFVAGRSAAYRAAALQDVNGPAVFGRDRD